MADPIEETVDLLYLVLIGLAAYIGYKLYTEGTSFINNLFGVQEGAGTYSNAASQAVQHPLDTLGSIVGLNQGSGDTSGQTVAGTLATMNGQNYRCNGTQCYPIATDSNGNETVSGVPIPQTQVLIGSTTSW